MNPYEAPHEPNAPPPDDARGRDRFWAVFLAVVSLFFCAPLTAPFSLLKANRLLRRGPDGFAVVAIVLAIVGLVSSLLFWFLAIWQFLSPSERVPP